MEPTRFSVKSRARSFRCAFKGLKWLIREEHNAWIYLLVIAILIPVCIIVHLSAMECALISLAIGIVFSAELFNTAIERLASRISPEHDPLIGKIKDLAAAGVLMAALAAAAVGLIILVPKVFF